MFWISSMIWLKSNYGLSSHDSKADTFFIGIIKQYSSVNQYFRLLSQQEVGRKKTAGFPKNEILATKALILKSNNISANRKA